MQQSKNKYHLDKEMHIVEVFGDYFLLLNFLKQNTLRYIDKFQPVKKTEIETIYISEVSLKIYK